MPKDFKPPFYLKPDGSFTIPDEGRQHGKNALGLTSIPITVAAHDAPPSQQFGAEFVCDGVDDHIEIIAALASLPINGGKVLLSPGHFYLGATVSKDNKDSVIIEGVGPGTFLSLDNSTPVINVADCDRWSVLDLTTDNGGVNVSIATNYRLHYWVGGIHGTLVQHPHVPASPVPPPVYSPLNAATVRGFDANNTSLDELADVVGTLINDLGAWGLLSD
jgi:hypothetical protein